MTFPPPPTKSSKPWERYNRSTIKTWKNFAHVNAKILDEAAALMQKGNASIISGGTDLLGALRFEILPTQPEVGVNLKSIPGLNYIKEEGGC